MITDREIADKRNEVLMLRLQIAEHKERRKLDEVEQLELTDVLPSRNELVDRLESVFALNRQQEDTNDLLRGCIGVLKAELSNSKSAIGMKNGVINDRNETISDLRMAASDMLDTINECARGEAEDSRVLMQVVEIVKEWGRLSAMVSTYDMRHLRDLLVDYLDAPESPVVMLKTPSMGTRVVSKNENTHTIDEAKMKAVQSLVECGDNWVVCTDEDAIEVMQQKDTIDELTETTKKLEGRLSSMYAANSDQDTTINKLNALLADEKMTLSAYRNNPLSDQVADRDNRIEQLMVLNEALRIDMELAHNLSRDHIAGQDRTIEGNGKIIDELNDMYCDVCGKLERIEKIAEHPAYDCFSTALDEITKIIQEE